MGYRKVVLVLMIVGAVFMAADIAAHGFNATEGSYLEWFGIPFSYGTVAYEITALVYWSTGLAVQLCAIYIFWKNAIS